jgi:uncharacterized protein (UPF0332 family)
MTDSRQHYILYRIQRSEELFSDAQLLAAHAGWRSCINRLYYSSFHLVNALLFQQGTYAKSHDGLKTKFLQHFVKTGRISIEAGKLYALLHDWRQESDYAVFKEFTGEDVMPLLDKVAEFNQTLIDLIDQNP